MTANTSFVAPIASYDETLCESSIVVDGITVACENPGTVRMRGEADSFGVEWLHFCGDCAPGVRAEWAAEDAAERAREAVGNCRICREPSTELRQTRMFTENSWDEATYACVPCIAKEADARDAEWADMGWTY